MSLILTAISRAGIIHATDSNLSDANGPAGIGRKLFPVPYLPAALSLAGSYSVGGTRMDVWMQQAIDQYAATPVPTLQGLGEHLRARLEVETQPEEQAEGILIHLCGYVLQQNATHPEFYFIRNITGIDPSTGDYTGLGAHFTLSEDFWARDYLTQDTRTALAQSGQHLYINGFPAGRIGYLTLMRHFGIFLITMWTEPQWSFRPPATLEEASWIVDLQFRAIGTLFRLSNYPAPFIGGDLQLEQIPAPPDSVTL
jgi:hypothetical protein